MMFMVKSTRNSRRFCRLTLHARISPVRGAGYFYVHLNNEDADKLRQRRFKFEEVPSTAFVC